MTSTRGAGLSPRVRGNLRANSVSDQAPGSIPACAGEPRKSACRRFTTGVYPRVCGGTQSAAQMNQSPRGLSPRVRGNPGTLPADRRHLGSIPACAGEPRPKPPRPRSWTVYPRVCGGTGIVTLAEDRGAGLSPRVRGNLCGGTRRGAAVMAAMRSIPACAGEPAFSALPRRPCTVYPRVCGGTHIGGRRPRICHGLSPRVRGNLEQGSISTIIMGSIPACAGEP